MSERQIPTNSFLRFALFLRTIIAFVPQNVFGKQLFFFARRRLNYFQGQVEKDISWLHEFVSRSLYIGLGSTLSFF